MRARAEKRGCASGLSILPHLSSRVAGVRQGLAGLHLHGIEPGSTATTNNKTPTVLGWGFSCLIAPVPACSWGFLRKPADFASHPNWPSRAAFHSPLAIPRSDLAPLNWPEVRKARSHPHYGSTGYARTNQAVGLRVLVDIHWVVLLRRTIVSPALTHALSNRNPDGDGRKLQVRHQPLAGLTIGVAWEMRRLTQQQGKRGRQTQTPRAVHVAKRPAP